MNLSNNIKIYFTDNVVISFCEEIVATFHCDEVVRVYIVPNMNQCPKIPENEFEIKQKWDDPKIEPSERFKDAIRKLLEGASREKQDFIHLIVSYHNYLIKEKTEDEIIKIINVMINKNTFIKQC